MDITYLGAGSVKIVGRNIAVVCDPPVGMGSKSDVVVFSSIEAAKDAVVADFASSLVIDSPGEYEVKGSMIVGVPTRLHIDEDGHRGQAYSMLIDGINVVFVGNIAGKLDDNQVENLGNVDVLVLPVGGHGLTLDAQGAAEVVAQLEPGYVVPVHYDDGVTQYPVQQDPVSVFLKEMGTSNEIESEAKLRVSQRDESVEAKVVVLARTK